MYKQVSVILRCVGIKRESSDYKIVLVIITLIFSVKTNFGVRKKVICH